MTKEQMQIIEKHFDLVDMAYRTSSVRGATTEIKNELMDLYVELGYRRQNIACNTCVISYLQTLGALYYQQKDEENKQKLADESKQDEQINTIEEKKQPTRTQKKQTKTKKK